jgi:DNA-binding NtrC family response regulator
MSVQPAVFPRPPPRVLTIDDDESILHALRALLGRAGCEVSTCADPVEGLARAREPGVELVLCDVQMPHLSGMEVLRELRSRPGAPDVLLMTAHASVAAAVAAMEAGASDYLTKPFLHPNEVLLRVARAIERRRLRERARTLEGLLEVQGLAGLVGQSEAMQRVARLVESVAPASVSVLLRGESGTGKEVVARAIHQKSGRREKPFVAINCSALSEGLLESELFGHVKGSFTGAVRDKKGLFEQAHGGTLFLDEIGDISPATQVRLLRVLQEGEVRPVGASAQVPVDVRVVAATHRNLEQAMAAGTFREDLFYRLNVLTIELPPLRKRPEDIPLLAQHFLRRAAGRLGKPVSRLEPEALAALQAWRWPGNVRELENAMERAVLLAQGEAVRQEDLPPQVAHATSGTPALPSTGEDPVGLSHLPFSQAKELNQAAFERIYLRGLLRRSANNIAHAAQAAGMDRSNFRRLMRRAGIEPGDADTD